MRNEKKKVARKPSASGLQQLVKAGTRVEVEAEALATSLGYLLRRAQLSTYPQFSAAMAAFDVRPSQFAALVLIRANPGCKQSAVSSALGIQKTNFVSLLDRLESRGLTERRRVGGDRRSSALHLTAEGEEFVAELEAAHGALEKELASRLGATRSRELLKLLRLFSRGEPS